MLRLRGHAGARCGAGPRLQSVVANEKTPAEDHVLGGITFGG